MNKSTIEELTPLVNQFCEMLYAFHRATQEAVGEAMTSNEMKKILELQAYTLQKTFQTLGFGIDIMKDEDMLRVWTPKSKN
jgi:hypothetical protein